MAIYWREQLSVSNTIIDVDHRYLICLVNMVSSSLAHPDDSLDDLKYAVEELLDYTILQQ